MRIIISPAKKMNVDEESYLYQDFPVLLNQTKELLTYIKGWSYQQAKDTWKCNEKLTDLNYERMQQMDLEKHLTPAIISYEGIQYQYMAPKIMEASQLEYLQEHLRILSGFYGILKPMDGVRPYRLEMQARLTDFTTKNLYEYWGEKLAQELLKNPGLQNKQRLENKQKIENKQVDCIVNLASKEYSKSVEKYLPENVAFITCVFGEEVDGKIKEKGTQVKMARGEMVRYMAENQIEDVEEIKKFNRLGYHFREDLSSQEKYVFVKEQGMSI